MSNKKETTEQNNVVEMVQAPKEKTVNELLNEDVFMISGINYTHEEAIKFVPLFEKIKQDLIACIEAFKKDKEMKQGGEKNAEADPE